MKSTRSALTSHMVATYCEKRLAPVFTSEEVHVLRGHLVDLLEQNEYPVYRGSRLDVRSLADRLGLDPDRLKAGKVKSSTNIRRCSQVSYRKLAPFGHKSQAGTLEGTSECALRRNGDLHRRPSSPRSNDDQSRGKPPRPIVEFPEPLEPTWNEPSNFGAALRLHTKRHGESIYHLYNAVVRTGDGIKRSTFVGWGRRNTVPTSSISLDILCRIERRYRLPEGYFSKITEAAANSVTNCELDDMTPAERRRLVWHLPDDFRRRSRSEQTKFSHGCAQ